MKTKKLTLPIQYREFEINRAIDEEKRTVELSFSSETPVERFWGTEILDHNRKSVIMDRLKNAAAFLFNHDRMQQIGVIESASIDSEEKKGHAVVRFSRSEKAEEFFQDVKDGIRKLVSVGYRVLDAVLEKHSKEDGDTYRIMKWEPLEISLVSIPADPSVGVGRQEGEEITVNILNQRGEDMTPEEIQKIKDEERAKILADNDAKRLKDEADAKAKTDADKAVNDIRSSEEKRVKEILAIGETFLMREEASKAITEGTSELDFKNAALEKLKDKRHIDTNSGNLGMSDNEIKKYSLMRAIDAQLSKNWKVAEFEHECSREVAKLRNKEANGFYVPHDVLTNQYLLTGKRDVTVVGAPGLVATEHLAGSFIDLLRNKSAIVGAGALMLTGLRGDLSIPKQTGAATAFWVTEGSDVTESTPTFSALTMGPKTIGAFVDITRKMRIQSNPAIEALIYSDLTRVIALALDLASVSGTGADGQPTGILLTSGIGDVVGTAIDWAKIVEFETDVAAANGDIGSMAYLTNAVIRGILKTREKATGTAQFLCMNNEVNGYPLKVSNQVVALTMIFGVFSQILIGLWSGLDLMIDEVTLGDSGGIRLRAFQDADVGVRQPSAFSASDEID